MSDRPPVRALSGIPPIKAWMTPFPFSIDGGEPLSRARQMIREHGFHHLPVKDGEELVGVISDRGVDLALDPRGRQAESRLSVRDVALDAYVVDLSTPADRVLLEMARRHTDSALITRRGALVGIFTVTDACRCFGQWLRSQFRSPPGTDAA